MFDPGQDKVYSERECILVLYQAVTGCPLTLATFPLRDDDEAGLAPFCTPPDFFPLRVGACGISYHESKLRLKLQLS